MILNEEALIEAYVRDPASLSEPQRSRVRELISRDKEALALSEFFVEFYNEFNSQDCESSQPAGFVQSLFSSPKVVRLRLRKPRQIDPASGLHYPTVLLAATVSRKSRYTPLGSVIADDGCVVIRFLMDDESNEGRGFVLSNESNFLDHTILSVGGSNKHFLSDSEGRFRFRLSHSEMIDLVNQELLIRRSIAEFDLDPSKVASTETTILAIDDNSSLHARFSKSSLVLHTDHELSLLVSIQTSASAFGQIHAVSDQEISIRLINQPCSVRIRVFE